MTSRKLSSLLSALTPALLLVGCATRPAEAPATPTAHEPSATTPSVTAEAVPDAQIGLREADVLATPPAVAIPPLETDPAEATSPARAFSEAPPVIPHAVADLLPITREENACLDCHHPDTAADVGARAVPASHFEAPRRLNGRRWVCVTCHAPQTGAMPLVDNRFQP